MLIQAIMKNCKIIPCQFNYLSDLLLMTYLFSLLYRVCERK